MRQGEKGIKRHIISMRVSAEEWDSLNDLRRGLQMRYVSDIMREAFKLIVTPPDSFEAATSDGRKRIG